ncbi:MAG: tripartite tricarboxylate transporter substrate binding protein [Ramlibacter sp.]
MTIAQTPCHRRLACLVLAAAAMAPLHQALSQTAYPTRPVKLINSFPPGGPSDILSRALAEVLQNTLKQAFIVENKPGAAGNIGADSVAKSAPDGYTVLTGIDTTVTVNPHIYKGMPFKPSDLKTVMVMASSGLLIGVNPGTGFKTLNDLIAAAKAKGVNFSSAGAGSPGHLAAALFTEATGAKINHIPYKGNTPAVTAVLSGEVDGGVLATPGMLPHVKAGKITALAVTSQRRSALAPEIPTVADAGLKSLEQEVLYVIMVPAATPDSVVQVLQRGIAEALARPDMQARMTSLDMHFEGLTGAAAAKRLSDLSDGYARVIKSTGLKVE